MRLLALLTVFVLATAQKRCPGIHLDGRYYNVEILKDGVNKLHQIVLNRNDNILYFIYEQIERVPMLAVGFLNTNTRNSGPIEGIRNASSVSIDQARNIVYIGGADGIYRLNSLRPERMPIRDDIRSIFFKDVLYYTNGRNEAFVYQNGFINPMFELQGVSAHNLILDDDNNIFFTQNKNLFRIKIGTRAINTHEKYIVELMTVDNFDRPYMVTKDGVYVYNKYKYVLDKVSNVNNLRGLTFNKTNEPIIAVLDTVYKLNLSDSKCFSV